MLRAEFSYLHPQKVIAFVRVHVSPALYARGPQCSRQVEVYRTSPLPPRTVRSGFLLLGVRFVGQTVKFRRPRFVAVMPPSGACRRHTCTRTRRLAPVSPRQGYDYDIYNDHDDHHHCNDDEIIPHVRILCDYACTRRIYVIYIIHTHYTFILCVKTKGASDDYGATWTGETASMAEVIIHRRRPRRRSRSGSPQSSETDGRRWPSAVLCTVLSYINIRCVYTLHVDK